jgi:hypothetical protein
MTLLPEASLSLVTARSVLTNINFARTAAVKTREQTRSGLTNETKRASTRSASDTVIAKTCQNMHTEHGRIMCKQRGR